MNLGPISTVLEAELRGKVRRDGVVLWLDVDGHYTGFVDRLIVARAAAELPYDVLAFRGSYLRLMLALDGVAGGVDRPPLVVHLPGFTEESVRETPVFELYASGKRFRKALTTLVTEGAAGRVRPDQIAAIVEEPGLSLDEADVWLTRLLDRREGGAAARLASLAPESVFDGLLAPGGTAAWLGEPDDARALWNQLTTWTGVTDVWRAAVLPASPGGQTAADVAFATAGWALAVEYVDDLKRAPVSPWLAPAVQLPRGVRERCRALASHLRDRHRTFYRQTATETEARLDAEVDVARAEDLGKIDTFHFEEAVVLTAALGALARGEWDLAAGWAQARVGGQTPGAVRSFWLREEPARESAWRLIDAAATLGQAIARAGARLEDAGRRGRAGRAVSELTHDDAVTAYTSRGAAVDEAHRHLEERRIALLYPQLPEFEALRAMLDAMRGVWRLWAEAWAHDFSALCRREGFLPPQGLQQRTLFDDVVRPLTQDDGCTALFMVDALRFEMGEELRREIARELDGGKSTTIHLKARLAELPTITAVGMNALAPVSQGGRLRPAISADGTELLGLASGEFRVDSPESRRRVMAARVGGRECPLLGLEEVLGRERTQLKRTVAQGKLVVIHSAEVDTAGENGFGPTVFGTTMQQLRAAWRLLRDAGVRRFVFTSDHGYLLLDGAAQPKDLLARRAGAERRHALTPLAADHAGQTRVALADLGYEGTALHVHFPEALAVFDTGKGRPGFVHGGNSLQERVIPVLTVVHRGGGGTDSRQYGVTAVPNESVLGMHCLEITATVVAHRELDFVSARDLELALRVVAPEAVGRPADEAAVSVELCQTRGRARIVGASVVAPVGESFLLFFRLTGLTDARVQVELFHPSAAAEVVPCVPDARFAVLAAGVKEPERRADEPPPHATRVAAEPSRLASWLDQLDDSGHRQFFEHLTAHGVVTEPEAAGMLGGPRGLRRFANRFDELADKAPFAIRIDVVGGIKRYVRVKG